MISKLINLIGDAIKTLGIIIVVFILCVTAFFALILITCT